MITLLASTHEAGWVEIVCKSAFSVWEACRMISPIEFWVIGDDGSD